MYDNITEFVFTAWNNQSERDKLDELYTQLVVWTKA